MKTKDKIEQLKNDIAYIESSLESAREFPTETSQFYSAMAKQEAELQSKKTELESLLKNDKEPQKRTKQQNKALHVLFRLLAQTLNENGLDMRKTLKPEVDIAWTESMVKEYLWRPIQQVQLRKKSTTELTTKEVDGVFDTINRHIGEKFGLHIPFPSIEQILLERGKNETQTKRKEVEFN